MAVKPLGRFIAFEGGEGAGKSTQARMLAAALAERGIDAVLTREPGGTSGAESIRHLLLEPPGAGWGAHAEALLFAAARADHVASLIRPALEAGQWVICDRFLDSSRAYQGVALGLGDEAILALHRIGSQGLLPDLVLVMEVPAGDAATRLVERDGTASDAIGGRGASYHEAVNRAFGEFARQEPRRYALIDGNGAVDEVHQRVLAAMMPLLAGLEPC